MSAPRRVGYPPDMTSLAWECTACGHHNAAGAVCEACGVAKRYLDDPPLDLPYPPRLTALPGFYLGSMWAVLALLAAALLLAPAWRAALGLGPVFLGLGLASAAGAAWSSMHDALWQHSFNEMRLEVPGTAKSGEPFEATLTLVPYDRVAAVHVSFTLVDNFYQHTSDGSIQTRTRRLDRQLAMLGEPLSGRHSHVLKALFAAPFPASRHTDLVAEAVASLLGVLGFVVPGLGFTARNLRQHGGYFVSATVRVGWLRRTFKRRVITYFVGTDLYVG
jgi:ribosomal protein L32